MCLVTGSFRSISHYLGQKRGNISRQAECLKRIDSSGTCRLDRYQRGGIPQLAYRPGYLIRLSKRGEYKSHIKVAILGLISDPLLEKTIVFAIYSFPQIVRHRLRCLETNCSGRVCYLRAGFVFFDSRVFPLL